jgi:hypothetical protein
MAGRKRTINRKEQRADYEEETEKAEEEETEDEEEEGGDEDDEDAPKKKKKAKPKKAPAPKRTRSTKKVVRQKAVWVIFDNSSKQIETFPFNQRNAAEKLLAEKSEDTKKGYYLQMIKVPMDEK